MSSAQTVYATFKPGPQVAEEWNNATGALNDAQIGDYADIYITNSGNSCDLVYIGGVSEPISWQGDSGFAGYYQVNAGPIYSFTPTGTPDLQVHCNGQWTNPWSINVHF
jgi:hypothetical protein